jgi:general secretion pathway protein J
MSFRQIPPSEDGFTLVEVLLAVSLVAMMATLVFGSLFVTTSAIDAARANSANEQIVRSTLRVMTDELSVGVSLTTGPWMGINAQLNGQASDTIAFLTMGQFRGAESTKDTELVRIVYTREGDRLLRFVRRNLYGLTDESVEQVELAAKVKGFNVRYYDAKSKLWVDEWDGRGRSGTPKALLIELTVMPDSGMTPSTKSQLTISQENAELQTVRQWVAVGPSS